MVRPLREERAAHSLGNVENSPAFYLRNVTIEMRIPNDTSLRFGMRVALYHFGLAAGWWLIWAWVDRGCMKTHLAHLSLNVDAPAVAIAEKCGILSAIRSIQQTFPATWNELAPFVSLAAVFVIGSLVYGTFAFAMHRMCRHFYLYIRSHANSRRGGAEPTMTSGISSEPKGYRAGQRRGEERSR